jgi:subtilase family serine protease
MRCGSLVIAASFLIQTVSYAQSDRVRAVADDSQTVKLAGNTSRFARADYDAGPADAGHRMDKMILVLASGAEQKKALDELLAAQQDPASPQYQKWLTPEAFADQFGVSQGDVDQVTMWLKSHGFQIDEVPAGRRAIVFSGTAGMIAKAFHTQIRQYRVSGELHYANASDPEIPAALAPVVLGTVTLHDFPRKSLRTAKIAAPEYGSGSGASMGPADFATIYNLNPLYSAGVQGAGKTIAIVGRTNLNLADVTKFRSYFGLPVNNPEVILNGADPGITADLDEATLDVEWSGAVAPLATIDFVASASTGASDGVDLSAQYIVTHNLAPVMSTSYGSCEQAMGSAELSFYNNLWAQAAAQGISTMISAGDSGAAGCDSASEAKAYGSQAVNGLCSSVNSVCVGGTLFAEGSDYGAYWLSSMNATTKESAISYIPEVAWNQSGAVGGSELWATGGGVSAYFAKPSWQAGLGVPADGKRDVPDISLAASGSHNGYLIMLKGSMWIIGGTSASSPSFAGIMALVNQKYGPQGNPNPKLYALAAIQNQTASAHPYFHDVVGGSNTVPGVTGFTAGAGYDPVTGLGSVNGANLVNYWGDAVVSIPPSMTLGLSAQTLTVRPGSNGTVMAAVSVAGGFSGTVTLQINGLPPGVSAAFATASFPAPGSGTSILTIAAGVGAVPGSATLNVIARSGERSYASTLVVTIVPAFEISTSASQVSVPQGRATSVTVSALQASGLTPLSPISLTASTSAGVAVSFSQPSLAYPTTATMTMTVSNSATLGLHPIVVTGTYLVSPGVTISSSTNLLLTVNSPATFSLSASPTNLTVTPAGAVTAAMITMTPGTGWTSSVTLTHSAVPAGVTMQFSALSFEKSGGKLSAALQASATAAAGSYPITITGTGASGTSVYVVLTVVVPGFTISASPSASLARASTVSLPVGSSVTGGFSGLLSLTAAGLPAGVTASFAPLEINSINGTASIRLAAAPGTVVGTKSITIVATSAQGTVRTAMVSLTVH